MKVWDLAGSVYSLLEGNIYRTLLNKCIRMGITIFKMSIWGGILSRFAVSGHILDDIVSNPNDHLEHIYPLSKRTQSKDKIAG